MTATFVVETGVGLTNANSFVSVAVADLYNENHTESALWISSASVLKEKHLRLATQFISASWEGAWKGVKVSGLQSLPWPRYAVTVDGNYINSTPLPQALIEATCEAALRSMAGDTLMPDLEAGGSGGVTRTDVKIGPLEFETVFGSPSSPNKIYSLINSLLKSLTYSGSSLYRG